MAGTVILLPKREFFSPEAAGAVALVVQRFCAALPGAVVLGGRGAEGTFPGIPYIQARGWWNIWRALVKLRPDVIEVHQQARLALALALLFPRARVLLFLHNDPLTLRGLRTPWERRLVLRRLDRVVCVSPYVRDRYGGAPAVLPNPLGLDELPPPVDKERLILFAGRIVPEKGVDVFIEACAQALPHLPGWEAAVIGGHRFGPSSPETPYFLAQKAAAARAGVAFLGPRPHGEVLVAMGRAAIVAVPSRWAEAFGLTALEAMASGAALITTGEGGLRDLAGDAACYVPVGDAAAMAAAILRLARDEVARDGLVQAGRARAREFDTPAITPRLQALRDGAGLLHPAID